MRLTPALLVALAGLPLAAVAEPTLYLGMNGGTMERSMPTACCPPSKRRNNVKVVIVPGTSADILAKVQASPQKPPIHVMFLDDGIMYRAIGMNLCSPLKPSASLAQIPDKAKIKDQAAAVSLGVTGLAYNSRLFKDKGWAAPTSWADLADPKYKGKVVFQSLSSSTFGLHGFLMFNRLKGAPSRTSTPASRPGPPPSAPMCWSTSPVRPSSRRWCRPTRRRCSRSRPPRSPRSSSRASRWNTRRPRKAPWCSTSPNA